MRTCQMVAFICIGLIVGCSPARVEWPHNTGYVSNPTHKPAKPHEVDKQLGTTAFIHDVNEEGRLLYGLATAFDFVQIGAEPLLPLGSFGVERRKYEVGLGRFSTRFGRSKLIA